MLVTSFPAALLDALDTVMDRLSPKQATELETAVLDLLSAPPHPVRNTQLIALSTPHPELLSAVHSSLLELETYTPQRVYVTLASLAV